MQVRLYSNHPWRQGGGPREPFEQKVLDVLSQNGKDGAPSYHEFTELEGRPVYWRRR